MRELFFNKLIEGYVDNFYGIKTVTKNYTNEKPRVFLEVFDAEETLILKMEITKSEKIMLDFLMQHELIMKDYYSTALEIR